MVNIYVLLIGLWLLLSNFIEIGIMIEHTNDGNCPVYSPTVLYENTKMNWFGCWFCFIVVRLLVPVNTIMLLVAYIIYYIYIFFEWLFTVGRKEDEE
jgi:hypothetical protein